MTDDELIGRTIARYTILDKLGEGGMGAVYRARDARLDRIVAFKVLRPGTAHDAERRRRFVQEARAASALSHPHIVGIYDVDSTDDISYIAMEYVAGVTLDVLIARRLRLPDVLKYAVQIADALAEAHALGVVHRDLKPSNVIVTDRGVVKLLDFGLAKLIDLGPEPGADTRTFHMAPATIEGTIVGTVAYMSPEQGEGLPIDHRSDIFSFGTLLYEMVSGRRPFHGDTSMSTLSAILTRDPPALGETTQPLPPGLIGVINSCLRKERDRRIQHADDVKITLEAILEDLRSSSDVGRSRASERMLPAGIAREGAATRWWRALAPWGILVLVVAGSIAWMLTRREDARLPPVLTRLTADAGLSAYPALSPDGALMAFASDRGGEGSLDIWVQQTATGHPIRLTSTESDDYEPAFSPDGTTIAFRSDRDGGGIYVIPSLGGAARLIAASGRRPRFSPDGRWIAYWAGGMGSAFVAGSTSVYIVSATGGEPRRIRPEFAATRHPLWLPDGQLLFVGRWGDEVDWWVAPVEGAPAIRTNAFRVLRDQGLGPPPGEFTINPDDLHRDGPSVLFSATFGDSANIWQIDLSPRGIIAGSARRVTFGTALESQPAAAWRQADAVAFAGLAINVDIWSVPIDAARGQIAGVPERLTEALSFEGYADVSRDGRRLAFVASRAGGWDLRVRDLEHGADSTLVSGSAPLIQARISVDGSHVVYWERSETVRAVHIVSTSAGVPQKLCDDCGPATDVSAGGSLVLMDSTDGPEAILLVNTASKKQIPLVASAAHPDALLYNARFSPDLQWITFHAVMGSATTRQIFIVRYQGEHPANAAGGIQEADWIAVTDNTALDRDPYWSPDGNAVYFLSERDGFRCLWLQHLEPSTKRPAGPAMPVRHFHSARLSLSSADIRPSAVGVSLTAARMFFGLGELTGNIWLAAEQTAQARR